MRPAKPASGVWKASLNVIKSSGRQSTLMSAFTKNCGFLTGQEYRDSVFMLNAKNTHSFKENMVFVLSVGFNGLSSKKNNPVAMLLIDTVVIKNGLKLQIIITVVLTIFRAGTMPNQIQTLSKLSLVQIGLRRRR